MRTIYCLLAAALSAGSAATVGAAHAEYLDSKQVGAATVSIGAGAAWLTLPDVKFVKVLNAAGSSVIGAIDNASDFGANAGLNIGGEISFPVSGVFGNNQHLSVKGFWARIEDSDNTQCTVTATTGCAVFSLVDRPGAGDVLTTPTGILFPETTIAAVSNRTVNQWGVALESKWQLGAGIPGAASMAPHRYIALGADIRGIDQDLNLQITSGPAGTLGNLTYDESLPTRYYGAYAAFGTDIDHLPLTRWGLQTFVELRGGLYYAHANYSGRITDSTNSIGGALSMSKNQAAFIGGAAIETRKQIGTYTTLSLKSDFEYYSWVPEMNYNDNDAGPIPRNGPNAGTNIGDASAFSFRTMLRLTVALGGSAAR